LNHFRGSELQNYFTKILEDNLKALIKPQYVDQIPKAVKGTVQQLLDKKDERKNQNEICQLLGKAVWNMMLVLNLMFIYVVVLWFYDHLRSV
jgi:translation initiation factor RLI1